MKILMVCLGNICRSPLAEGILRQKLIENNLQHIEIDSAGTSDFHVGDAPDKRTQSNALNHGIDLSKLRGRQFQTKDFDTFDTIYVMDKSNRTNVLNLAKTENDRQKVKLILSEIDGKDNEVPDPYYGGPEGFENVFQLLNSACSNIIQKLQ